MFYIIMIAPVLIAMAVWALASAWLRRKIPAHKRKIKTAFAVFSLIVLALIPTYDIIITNILGAYYCKNGQEIFFQKKLNEPMSIYDASGTYDEKGRNNAKNNVDGIKIDTFALNGDDGKIYIYSLDKNSSKFIKLKDNILKGKELHREFIKVSNELDLICADKKNINSQKHLETLDLLNSITSERFKILKQIDDLKNNLIVETITTKDKMPNFDYTATFEILKSNSVASNFFEVKEFVVTDNKINKVVIYNKKYCPAFYNILPNVVTNSKYDTKNFCKTTGEKTGLHFLDANIVY